ncbi:MAG: hypothetical protein HOP18_18375, partial [Deltaproteobacteria bacterium]|nr:hypothetical protein [Deltaproteobacteria bacterium]
PVFKAIAQQALTYLGVMGDSPKWEGPATETPPSVKDGERAARPLLQPIVANARDSGAVDARRADPAMDGANFIGMSLREAVLTAQRNDWAITTRGSGYVIAQTAGRRSGKPLYNLTLAPTREAHP